MIEPIKVRPHHFLCVQGYKGAGYDATHVKTWEELSKNLSANPDTRVKVVMGSDDFCKNCPKNEDSGNFCDKQFVQSLDKQVTSTLGLKENMVYLYSEILQKLFEVFNPALHAKVCSGCAWRKQGFCQDTFKKIEIRFIA